MDGLTSPHQPYPEATFAYLPTASSAQALATAEAVASMGARVLMEARTSAATEHRICENEAPAVAPRHYGAGSPFSASKVPLDWFEKKE